MRNPDFVPSGVSTYPFLCTPPSDVLVTIMGQEIESHDQYDDSTDDPERGYVVGNGELAIYVLSCM